MNFKKNLSYLIIVLSVTSAGLYAQIPDNLFAESNISISARLNQYDTLRYNTLASKRTVHVSDKTTFVDEGNSTWQITSAVEENKEFRGVFDISITFLCKTGSLPNASVSADINFTQWSRANYVMLPGAVYNGNRYPSVKMDYMPFFFDASHTGIDKPILLSDQPRLNHADGISRLQLRSGSMAMPAAGVAALDKKQGTWLLFEQGNTLGDYQIDVEEYDNKSKATYSLTSPVVREATKYFIATTQQPSDDKPAHFKAGDSIQIKFQLAVFNCPTIQELFNKLAALRSWKFRKTKIPESDYPFSYAFDVIENKYNRENWRPSGYYAVGTVDHLHQDWQIGWVGGMMTTLPLLADGKEQSKERVKKNFDWLFPKGISPSGYYYDIAYKDTFYGAFPNKALGADLVLTRKNADACYYIFKQFDLMNKMKLPVKPSWTDGNFKALNAQINTWKKYAQLGQFVNQQSGELFIGNTTSAGIFPAALCAAFRSSADSSYLSLAEEIANYYYTNFIAKGISCGGPGDALQSFDSESAYGLLESLTELYETTFDKNWLRKAEEMAIQFSSWVVAYNYQFPAQSLFGQSGFTTKGAVYANTQNTHAGPAICTHSGIALLKLYRATKNRFYIDLLRDISRGIPQFLSTKEKPIGCLKDGYVNERVNMTDWLEPIGEIFCGSTWAETSLLLTATELPGIYVNTSKKETIDLDNVNSYVEAKGKNQRLVITNRTPFSATVKILSESEPESARPLGLNAFTKWRKVTVEAGKTIKIKL